MNIIVSVNNTYIDPLKVLTYSLVNHTAEYLDIYLLQTEQISENHISALNRILGKSGEIHIVDVPVIECNTRFSSASLSRIIAPFFLPETMHRALYLDADILVRKPIQELYDYDFGTKSICAIPDFACDTRDSYFVQTLKLSTLHHYVNSGVLLFNLDLFRTKYSFDEVFAQLKDFVPISSFIDQDFINDYFRDDIEYVQTIYNHPAVWNSRISPAIVHFLGEKKPWHRDYDLNYFWSYQKVWNSVVENVRLSKRQYVKNLVTKIINRVFHK